MLVLLEKGAWEAVHFSCLLGLCKAALLLGKHEMCRCSATAAHYKGQLHNSEYSWDCIWTALKGLSPSALQEGCILMWNTFGTAVHQRSNEFCGQMSMV